MVGRVPGGIYTDLMNAGIIDDVFFGYNDNSSRWIGRQNWTYSTVFQCMFVKNHRRIVFICFFLVNDTIKAYKQKNLVFEGLDTYASIYLNGIHVGSTNNMFVKYVFRVQDVLKVNNMSGHKFY